MMDDFLTLSAELTGFTEFDLLGTGQAESYLATVTGVVGNDLLADLLTTYRNDVTETADEQIRAGQLDRAVLSDGRFGPVARNILKLWYAGIWFELPDDWVAVYAPGHPNLKSPPPPRPTPNPCCGSRSAPDPPPPPRATLLGRAAPHPRRTDVLHPTLAHPLEAKRHDRKLPHPRQGETRHHPDPLVERRLPQHRHRHPLRRGGQRDGPGRVPGLQHRPQVPDRPGRAEERPGPARPDRLRAWVSTYFTIDGMAEQTVDAFEERLAFLKPSAATTSWWPSSAAPRTSCRSRSSPTAPCSTTSSGIS